MTLYMRDIEKFEEGQEKARADMLQRMLENDYSEEAILNLGFSKEEYRKAKQMNLETV